MLALGPGGRIDDADGLPTVLCESPHLQFERGDNLRLKLRDLREFLFARRGFEALLDLFEPVEVDLAGRYFTRHVVVGRISRMSTYRPHRIDNEKRPLRGALGLMLLARSEPPTT